jgi:nucleoside-diphosphate-sugar epimerase
MRIAVAGAHGQVARPLVRLLAAEGDEVADGATAAVVDLERAGVEDVAAAVDGCDAVVFAAGAGPGSGAARKDTMDRGGAVLLADAAERAGVGNYLLLSSMGAESVRDGAEPEGVSEPMLPYLRAKLAAEDDIRSRDLAWTVLRPGGLTDDPGAGRVRLAPSVERGSVPRTDVAMVITALLHSERAGGLVLELTEGDVAVPDAVTAVTSA